MQIRGHEIWLPSEKEIYGIKMYSYDDEFNSDINIQYEYYANNLTTKIQNKYQQAGYIGWWLRSRTDKDKHYGNDNEFGIVQTSTPSCTFMDNYNFGVSPCFCL